MIIFGGEYTYDLNDIFVFNLDTFKWSEIIPFGEKPKPRRFHSSVMVNDTMIIYGGCT